jgi:hypothetical protein
VSKYVRELDSVEGLRSAPVSDAAAAHCRTPSGKAGTFAPMTGDPYGAGDDGRDVVRAPGGAWWVREETRADVTVRRPGDLPDPVSGLHPLEDGVTYRFRGLVSSAAGLELGQNTVLRGRFAAPDGFICTGGGPAITGAGVSCFASNLYLHAPGGQLLDVSGGATDEFLWSLVSVNDAAGISELSSLGTVEGFRVPTFLDCNFGGFQGGLTFEGAPDKVYLRGTPIRDVTASGVTCLTFASGFSADIVSVSGGYFKGVQSDTVAVDYQGALPDQIFQYLGTTHDASVTTSNILTGAVGVEVTGVRVADSFPLSDSRTTGALSLNAPATTTINTQGTYELVAGATTLRSAERITKASNAVVEVEGQRAVKLVARLDGSMTGGNGDLYEFALFSNGSKLDESETVVQGDGSQAPVTVALSAIRPFSNGDEISIRVRNNSDTSDLTFESFTLSFTGA